jgi:hypothetical protein
VASCQGYGSNFLINLFPNDSGYDIPNPYIKPDIRSITIDESSGARPFRWAQWLGGLDFLSVEQDQSNKHGCYSLNTVFEQIRRRAKYFHALQGQLDSLGEYAQRS